MDRSRSESGRVLIGFTVGVWDLFHYGHKDFLRRCYGHCNYLVIGVMEDYWVMVQKGEGRPINRLEQRMHDVKRYGDRIVQLDTLDMTQYLQMADIWIKSKGQNKMRNHKYISTVTLDRTPDISTTMIINDTYQENKS